MRDDCSILRRTQSRLVVHIKIQFIQAGVFALRVFLFLVRGIFLGAGQGA
jgi:hypothetical protein